MNKIEISQEIKNLHQKYFDEEVIRKLELKKSKTKDGKVLDFCEICITSKEILATGSIDLLRKMKDKIHPLWSEISKSDKKSIEKIFNYKKFVNTNSSIHEIIKNGLECLPWGAYKFVLMLNLQTCPYCNEQYIYVSISSKGRVRPDLDHFLSKSKYPYFSLSLGNMVPSCKICNTSLKGKKEFKDDLQTPYEKSYNDDFMFIYDGDQIDIEVSNESIRSLLEIMLIKERYQHHIDIANEFIRKSQMYPEVMIDNILLDIGGGVDKGRLLADLYDYPLNDKDICKNVMGKLRLDLAKMLDLN